MKKRYLVMTFLAAALVFAGTSAFAWSDGHGRGFHRHGCGYSAAGMCLNSEFSNDQAVRINEIRNKYRAEILASRTKLDEARARMAGMRTSPDFDEAAFRKAFGEVSSAREELQVKRARMHSEIRSLLTPTQQKEIESLYRYKRQRNYPYGCRFIDGGTQPGSLE